MTLQVRGEWRGSSLLPHSFCETFDLPDRQDLFVHHTDEELLNRSGPEVFDDLLHGEGGHASWWNLRTVRECLPLKAVADVASRLETAEERAHAGVLERVAGSKGLPHPFGRGRTVRPEKLQDCALQLRQGGSRGVTSCHVTDCNRSRMARQGSAR